MGAWSYRSWTKLLVKSALFRTKTRYSLGLRSLRSLKWWDLNLIWSRPNIFFLILFVHFTIRTNNSALIIGRGVLTNTFTIEWLLINIFISLVNIISSRTDPIWCLRSTNNLPLNSWIKHTFIIIFRLLLVYLSHLFYFIAIFFMNFIFLFHL